MQISFLLRGSILYSTGQNLFFKEYDSPATHKGVARNCDYERNYSLFSKLSYMGFMLEGRLCITDKRHSHRRLY